MSGNGCYTAHTTRCVTECTQVICSGLDSRDGTGIAGIPFCYRLHEHQHFCCHANNIETCSEGKGHVEHVTQHTSISIIPLVIDVNHCCHGTMIILLNYVQSVLAQTIDKLWSLSNIVVIPVRCRSNAQHRKVSDEAHTVQIWEYQNMNVKMLG